MRRISVRTRALSIRLNPTDVGAILMEPLVRSGSLLVLDLE